MKHVELNSVRAKMVNHPGLYDYCSYSHISKDDHKGFYVKKIIVKNTRHLSVDGEKNLKDKEVFQWYAYDLEVLAYYVAENKNVKSVDPYIKAHFLNDCKLWSKLKTIDGDDTLCGVGHEMIRPRRAEFEKSDGSCQQIPVNDLDF